MIKADFDISKFVASADRMVQRHMPFAIARALTKVAQVTQARTYFQMSKVLDRPTPWMGKSLYVRPAIRGSVSLGREERMYASVGVVDGGLKRDQVPMGSQMVNMGSQNKMAIIGHLFVGAQREWKGFEKALMRVGVLPENMAAIPGAGVTLDQYGNIPRGFMIQLLAYFNAFRESGSQQNMTDKTRGRFEKRLSKKAAGALQFFVVKDKKSGRGLAPGIWQRVNFSKGQSAVKPIIIFGKGRPAYRQFIDIDAIGDEAYRDTFEAEYREAFAEALRTAR